MGSPGSPDSLARLRADLARLGEQVQELRAAVAAAAELADQRDQPGAGPAVRPPAGATAWVDIGPDRAPAMLAELAGWITTVLAYHRVVDYLHPCWYRHPGLVQVLLDVRAAWLAAYRDPAGGRVVAALDWSQRQLPQLERQVRELLGRCSGVRHEPAPAPPPIAGGPTLRGYALWWAGDRRPTTEPTPPAPATAPGSAHGVPRPREAPCSERASRPASDPGEP